MLKHTSKLLQIEFKDNKKVIFFSIPLILLLLIQISCQSINTLNNKSTNTVSEEQKVKDVVETKKEKFLPNNELTEEVLFKYLLAQTAQLNDDNEVAFYHFMDLSESTQDPRIAKSALRTALVLNNNKYIFKSLVLWTNLELDRETENEDILQTLQVRAVIFLKIAKDKLATQDLIKVVELSKNQEQGISRVEVILAQINDYSRSKNILNVLKKKYPENYQITINYVRTSLKNKDYVKADSLLNELFIIDPQNEEAYLLKSQLLVQTGKPNLLEQWYTKSIDILDENALVRLEYTKFLLAENRRKEAIEQLHFIVQENNEDAHILYSIGMLAMEIKEYKQAKIFFTKLHVIDNHFDQGAFLLGILSFTQENYSEALQWFNKIKGEKYAYESQLRIAIIYSLDNKIEDSLTVINNVLLNHQTNQDKEKKTNLLRLKADLLNRTEKYKESYQSYSNALILMPKHPELLYSRAMVAEKLNRIDLSEQDLLEIIKHDPKNSVAYNALGYILTENTDRYKDAKKYIEKALELTPNDMAVIDSMGWVLYKLGNLKESLKFLKQAYEINYDPEIAAHYGEALWIYGLQEKAKRIWHRALEKTPEHTLLKSTISSYTSQ